LIRVCLVGLGKTGKEIAKVILEQENMKLVSVVCSSKSQNLGKSWMRLSDAEIRE